jgi:hypothetical protein
LKRDIVLTLIMVVLSLACLFEVSQVKAQTTSDTTNYSWRNWVNVDVIYLGSDSITLKLVFQLYGNTLHNNTDIVISSIKSGMNSVVTTGGVTIQAWYSSDINMTTYVYTLSSQLVDIKQSENFPYDSWHITAQVVTWIPILFDDTLGITSTPSENYYCQYQISDSVNATQNHNLDIHIQHPAPFVDFVHITYLLPFVGLLFLLFYLSSLAYSRKDLAKAKDDLLLVSIGSIIFIPVYQIPLLSLKIPFLITIYDWLFIGLFSLYLIFISILLSVKSKSLK